jgi:quinol monooxygenase YgiN
VSIYQTAHYEVNPDAVDKVKSAIVEFVNYLSINEPGVVMYSAWQQKDDPTKFVHLFEFTDDAAHHTHGGSDAVHKFESAYKPELVSDGVLFTDYVQVATNTKR